MTDLPDRHADRELNITAYQIQNFRPDPTSALSVPEQLHAWQTTLLTQHGFQFEPDADGKLGLRPPWLSTEFWSRHGDTVSFYQWDA